MGRKTCPSRSERLQDTLPPPPLAAPWIHGTLTRGRAQPPRKPRTCPPAPAPGPCARQSPSPRPKQTLRRDESDRVRRLGSSVAEGTAAPRRGHREERTRLRKFPSRPELSTFLPWSLRPRPRSPSHKSLLHARKGAPRGYDGPQSRARRGGIRSNNEGAPRALRSSHREAASGRSYHPRFRGTRTRVAAPLARRRGTRD